MFAGVNSFTLKRCHMQSTETKAHTLTRSSNGTTKGSSVRMASCRSSDTDRGGDSRPTATQGNTLVRLRALRRCSASLTEGLWGPMSSTAQQHLLTSGLCVTFRQFLQYFKFFHTYICYGDQRLPVTENSDDGQDLLAKSNFNEGTYIVFLHKMLLHT